MINTTTKTTFNYFDEYGMVLRKDVFKQGNLGERDSIGRTFEAVWCYGYKDDGILKCIGTDYRLHRHPTLLNVNDCSRDHVSYAYMALKLRGNENHISWFRTLLKWKISNFARFTLDLWCYVHDWRLLYYVVQIPSFVFTVLWHKFVLWAGDFEPEPPQVIFRLRNDENNPLIKRFFTAKKKHLFWRRFLYPVYSLYNTSWQVYFLPRSVGKRIMQRLMLSICPEHNYVIKLLNKGTVARTQVESYLPMTGDRWTSHLSYQRCDRLHRVLTEEESAYNCLDKDILDKLWILRDL